MDDFLTYEDNLVNLNSCTIAGKVVSVEKTKGKVPGIRFVIGYVKHWANDAQQVPITCYLSGQERIEKLTWLKAGEWALVSGELTNKASVYAHRLEQLSASGRTSEDVDEFFEHMAIKGQAAERRR